ncbi:MAG: DNA-binding NarL/FixJ family response regulator [Rhodothermales bacterium]
MLEASPDSHVVILTLYEEPEYSDLAMQLGAPGYVAKAMASDELVQAIEASAGAGYD